MFEARILYGGALLQERVNLSGLLARASWTRTEQFACGTATDFNTFLLGVFLATEPPFISDRDSYPPYACFQTSKIYAALFEFRTKGQFINSARIEFPSNNALNVYAQELGYCQEYCNALLMRV